MASALVPSTLSMLAQRINAAHRNCEQTLREGLAHALEAGRLLLEAKAQLRHGGWLDWLTENCSCSQRTAQKYMQLAKAWPKLGEANAPRVADLSFRQVMGLVVKNGRVLETVPEAKRPAVLDLLEGSGSGAIHQAVVKTAERPACVVTCPPSPDSPPDPSTSPEYKAIAARPRFRAWSDRLNKLVCELEELEQKFLGLQQRESREREAMHAAILAEMREEQANRRKKK